ncbi:uncharacterized protein LOC108196354 [Daucus carota subsp. sativus]|uniref:uncharacterized protein LOC108196354 n=1 Tax=Daucus carota subsp. sativus TaxID=79200 RepID=UPI003082E834
MARRRVGDASAENGKNKEEEIDTCRAVYIDTNLDTHLALVVSEFDSVLDIKKKVMLEHLQCFPKLGEIRIQALKVKRKGHFYHLSDSMRVNRAFEGVKHSWFLFVDASYSKQLSENEQSCRPNMSNQSPLLCLPYNIANTECNNDDASTSAILKSASVERLSNQKAQPIPEASGREFFEVIVTNHECSGAEIKTVSADLNRVPDLPSGGTIASNIQCSDSVEPSSETGLSVKKKKQKIKKHNVDELGDCLTKENIALSHVSGGEALCHEILLSTNMVVNAEKSESKGDALLENNGLFCNPTQMTSKEATILPKGQCDSQIIALNTISPESTDADQTPLNLRIENMKSKKKRKRDEMDLPSPDDHERANIPSNLLINTEKKEHKEIGDPSKENKVPVSTSKEEIELPRNFEEQNNSANIVLDTLSSEPADTPHLRTKPDIKNKRGEKKGKKDVKRKKDVTFNLPSAAVLPLCVQDAGVDESFQEKNNFLNHVSGEDESQHEVPSAEKTEIVGTSGDASKENKVLVSTNETSTQEIEMKEKCQKIVVDTFPSAAADSEHVKTGTGIKSKKNKKRKTDAVINISNSAKDAGGGESLNDKKSASNNVSAGDEVHHENAVLANLSVDGERTDCEKIRDSSEQDKKSLPSEKTFTRGTGLTGNTVEDRRPVVSGTISRESADNEHSITNSSIKHKRKKKSKKDMTVNISSAIVLHSSAQNIVEEESYTEKNIALDNCSGKDESHQEVAAPANLLVNSERTELEESSGDHLEQNKGSVSKHKNSSAQEMDLKLNSVQDQDNSQNVVSDTLSPEFAESEHPGAYSDNKKLKKKKRRKMDAASTLSGANVLPSSAQNVVEEESYKEKNIALDNGSGKDESHQKVSAPANLLVNSERTELEESSGDHLEQNKGSVSKHKNSSAQEMDLKLNSLQDQENSQNVVSDTLSPELAESKHPGASSDNKKLKKKKKRKMDAASTLSGANVLPSSVQDAAGEESLKEKNIPLHEDQSRHETVTPAKSLVNAERPEQEEITRDPLEKGKDGFNATSTSIELNLDSDAAPISNTNDSVNVQSAKMMDDKSKRDQAILITPSQPAVSKSESDRIDLKHYLLSGKTEDVADSVKSGIKRSERDDKTKKKTKKSTPTLLTSHDHTLTLQSSKNLEGGVKSHNKCSSDIDPQESFSKDASSGSHPPSKKSTSNVYQKEPSSSLGPDKARTPHSVLLASGRGIFVNSTPATAYRKGKNVTPAALGSSSESFDKLDRGTKSKNRVSTADRRVVSCAKGTSEVKSRPLQKKSLLTKAGSIFKDDSSDSSDNDEASEHFNARTSSEDVLSSESDRESDINLDSPTKGSSGLDKKEDAENIEKKRSNLRNTTMDMILRSSSRYKKAKLTAESQPEVEDSESQPVDCVPDSQAI